MSVVIVDVQSGEKTTPVSGSMSPSSPGFSPARIKFPKHIHHPIDDQFEKLAGTIFEHCNTEAETPYDIPQLPIEENQQKADMVRQMKHRFVSLCMFI